MLKRANGVWWGVLTLPLSSWYCTCGCWTATTITSELHEQLVTLLPASDGKKSVMGVCKPSQRNHVAWLSLAADPSFCHCSVMVIQYKNAPKLCFLTATELLSYSSSAALGVKPVLWNEICKHSAPSVYISKGKWHFINTELCYSQHLIFYIGFISQIYWLSWEDWNVNLTSLAVL